KEGAEHVPVVIKVTPQVADIIEVVEAVREGGADAVCASNTIPSLTAVDLDDFTPIPKLSGKSTYGGYSGPAIKPISLRTIAEIARHTGIPITGTGGPTTHLDAIEFMAVGATTVQFCTAVMHYGYDLIDDLLGGLTYYLIEHGFHSPMELIGRALPHIGTHDELRYDRAVVSHLDESLCIGCGRCYVACRDGGHEAVLFDAERRVAWSDPDKCVGCGLCPLVCPVTGCITMRWKDEVTTPEA
ncbi:4Fe-4S binding protein, partial [bacterium]|nr:4Fe-4S binding protein [candidate division CSSED10-310 bacterium]